MSLFKDMDLYKGVILASLVLLPVLGWWIYGTDQKIELAERAVLDATKTNGYLEEIGKLQQQIEIVERNKLTTRQSTSDHKIYFETQVLRSASNGGLGAADFNPTPVTEERTTSGNQRVVDYVTRIEFGKAGGKDIQFSRDLLFAILFNCESGARTGNEQLPSIWKVRKLDVRNAAFAGSSAMQGPPPSELEDAWVIRTLEFARREPDKARR